MFNGRLGQSFRDALRGIGYVFKTERNFRIQVIAAALVFAGIAFFSLRTWEIVVLILLVVMVLVMELINTAFEHFSDLLKPRLHHYVRNIKDIMAGAVLLTAIAAALIAALIFFPHFLDLVK